MEENTALASVQEPWEQLSSGLKAWDEFEPVEQERIVRNYAPRIRYIALRLKSRMPAHVDLGDLVSAGTLGLLDALGKFRPDLAVRFETYADSRIRGAMLDELRRLDWMPRKLRAKMRLVEDAMGSLESQKGRCATEEELHAATGLPIKDVRDSLVAIHSGICLSLELLPEQSVEDFPASTGQPQSEVVLRDLASKLVTLVDGLTEREKLVLSLYYVEECSMREVARILNISEGRISQLHTDLLHKLKRRFLERYGEDSHAMME